LSFFDETGTIRFFVTKSYVLGILNNFSCPESVDDDYKSIVFREPEKAPQSSKLFTKSDTRVQQVSINTSNPSNFSSSKVPRPFVT
jgi:hypothetical protein